jgi:Glycosyl transferase family 2
VGGGQGTRADEESRALDTALAGLAGRLDAFQDVQLAMGQALEGLARRLDALEAAAIMVGPTVAGLSERIDALEAAPSYAAALRGMATRLDATEAAVAVEAVTRWVAHGTSPAAQHISVVTPTHNRPDQLRRAIASVRAQTHDSWEMIVVDDGGELDTAGVVAEAAEPRIRHSRIDKSGVCAARNRALSLATGSIVAYLDDDNVMDPGWLQAVAWTFAERPDIDVVYGGLVIDDLRRAEGRGSGALPQLYLRAYDRYALLTDNLTDMSAIAHRAGLAEAHFDGQLDSLADWDLLIRLTTRKPPLVLPVIACYYSTAGADRLSLKTADVARSRESILAAHAVERRLGREEP